MEVESKHQELNDKDKLFMMTLDTFMFMKRIVQHKETNNKIDKKFATTILDVVNQLESFLETSEIVENEEDDEELNDLISSVDSSVLQLHHYYYCKACNQSVKSSQKTLQEHFLSNKHLNSLRTLSTKMDKEELKSRKQRQLSARDDENDGSTQSLNGLDDKSNKKKAGKKERLNSLPATINGPKRNVLPKKLREILTVYDLESIAAELVREGNALQKSLKHVRVCDMLRKRLFPRYPNVKAYAFGSFVTGLGQEKTDLDIFIDTENCFNTKLSKRKMREAIFQTQRILSNSRDQWKAFLPIVQARTPILRVYCGAENIDCDLSFSNGLSTVNTALISYMIDLQPICKKLIHFIKFWGMKLSIGTNSYLLSLMVIFYLQQEMILPPVSFLQNGLAPRFIDNWNTAFTTPNLSQLKVQLATDFRRYLLGFFYFYGFKFDYVNNIICPLTGSSVSKDIFNHGKEQLLPPVFAPFVNYMSKINLEEADEVEDLFANYKPLVIQDPFELVHNISKGVQEQKLIKIIQYMQSTYELLTDVQA